MGAQEIANAVAGLFNSDAQAEPESEPARCPHCGQPKATQEDEPMSKKINKMLGVGDPQSVF